MEVCTQCPLGVPVCPRAIGIMDPQITNSRHTGSIHGQAASIDYDGPLPRKQIGVGTSHVSRDRPPVKKHGQTAPRKFGTNSSHTWRVHDQAEFANCGDPQRSRCADSGHASKHSSPANKSSWTATVLCYGPATAITGRHSRIQEMHARPPLVRKKLGSEPHAADDMPCLLLPIVTENLKNTMAQASTLYWV